MTETPYLNSEITQRRCQKKNKKLFHVIVIKQLMIREINKTRNDII